jgi:ferredoxin
MALMILDRCLGCGICQIECPTDAIYENDDIYAIDPDKCVECVGFYDKPLCVILCNAKAIVRDLDHIETREELISKAQRL